MLLERDGGRSFDGFMRAKKISDAIKQWSIFYAELFNRISHGAVVSSLSNYRSLEPLLGKQTAGARIANRALIYATHE